MFEFASAGNIVFGVGAAATVGAAAASLGGRALLVTGRDPDRAQAVLQSLREASVSWDSFCVTGEPTVDDAIRGAAAFRAGGCALVVAVGGGSALDAGKAIAALATNPGDPLDHLEVIGRGLPLRQDPAPVIAVPTTSGTGSEVTRNAVLAAPAHAVKVSLRSPKLLPRVAVVDPALTLSLPPAVTADTGLDALTQVIEPYLSSKANPLTDALCREGIVRAARSLQRAHARGDDLAARTDMCVASLCGGLALANAGLGAVHGFAGPIGGMFPAPHGGVCARLLPEVLAANAAAIEAREPASPVRGRLREVAQWLTGDPQATIADGVAWVRALAEALAVRPLSAYGMTAADVPAVVAKAQKASSMRGNPIALTDEELARISLAAL